MEGHSAPPGCGAGLYDGVLWNRKPEGEGLMEYLDRCRSPRQGSARCYAGHHVDGKRHGPGQLLLDAEGNGIVAGTFEDNTLVHGTRRYPSRFPFLSLSSLLLPALKNKQHQPSDLLLFQPSSGSRL